MAYVVRALEYFATSVPDKAGAGHGIVAALAAEGVNLLAVSGFPAGTGKAQLDLIPEDAGAFARAAARLKLRTRKPKGVFLLQGDDQVGAVAEVLGRLSQEILSFLLRTSILTRLSGALCDAVTGSRDPQANGHAFLRQIEQANLFLTAFDEHGEWYACHPLFRELLQHELQTRYSQSEIVALHRNAGAWFGERGMIDQAIEHALAAGDTEGAARLVEQQLHPILNQEDWRTLEHWLSLLPENLIQQRPALLLARAFIFHFQSKLGAISSLLQQAEALLERSGLALDEPDQRAVRGGIDSLRSQNLYFENNSEAGLSAQRALENLPRSAVFARGMALGYLALHHHHTGRGDVALPALQQFIDTDAAPGVMTIRALLGLCFIYRQDGRFDDTAHTARQMLALAQAHHLPLCMPWAHYFLGCVAYERNELDAAREHFLAVSEHRYNAHVAVVYDSLVGLALTYQAHGWAVEAQETLQDLTEHALETNSPPALKAAQALEAHLAVARGDLDTARALFEALESPPRLLFFLDPAPLIQIRILLAQASAVSLRQAAERLQTLRRFAEATHSTWHLYTILALQAVADDRLGNQKDALATLRQALLAAQPQRFVRTFVDTSPAMAHLLAELRSHGVATQYVDRLLSAFVSSPPRDSGAPAVPIATRVELVEPLTAREVEVLQHLDQRYSDKEIAQMLGVSSFTVYAHARNIYGKLDVNNRREAVSRAKAIGILANR
jgi:LuxR family maltose regulon positive regulatory protein